VKCIGETVQLTRQMHDVHCQVHMCEGDSSIYMYVCVGNTGHHHGKFGSLVRFWFYIPCLDMS